MGLHTIIASNPFGPQVWDLTNLASELRLSNVSPGGHADCTIVYEDVDPLTTPGIGSNLVIRDDLGPYWSGRVEDVQVNFRPGGGRVTIIGRGMGASAGDQIVTQTINWNVATGEALTIFQQGTGVRDAFKKVVQNLCPFFDFRDQDNHVGASLAGDTQQLIGKSAQECFNELASLGSDLGNGATSAVPIYWHVYSGEALNAGTGDSGSHLELKYKDQGGPSYYIDMKDCDETDFTWQLKWVFNRVTVQFQDANGTSGTVTAIDPSSKAAFPLGVGIWKDHFVDGSSHIGTYNEASLMAQSLVKQFSQLKMIGKQIRIKYPMTVLDVNNNVIPLWRVLAGRSIQINNINPNNGQLNTTSSYYIRQTDWDEYNRVLTIVTEENETFPQIVGRAIYGEMQTPNSPISGHPAIPQSPPKAEPGTLPGPGGGSAQQPSLLTGQPNRSTPAAAEQGVSNPQFIVNGFGAPITIGEMGWLEISFGGHVNRLTLYATKKTETDSLASASATVKVYDADGTDYAHRTLIATLTASGGYYRTDDLNYAFERDHLLMFDYTAGDAEIMVISALHNRDATVGTNKAEATPPGVETLNVTTSGSQGGGIDATINLKTTAPTTIQVGFGEDHITCNSPVDNRLVRSHTYVIPSLASGKTYTFLVTIADKDGGQSTSGGTFTT